MRQDLGNIKNAQGGPASVAQWVGHPPTNRKFMGSIPGQGTCLGCGLGPWLGVCESQLIDISLTH